ncbi:probable ATP-binding cassette sub-family A member 3 [Coccomyxa sp. Obi]|nr:probable ATP-binding cassette sub-family A member 3 [Coccomyxa sp. Obi]
MLMCKKHDEVDTWQSQLHTRSGRSFFGAGGWVALLLEILTPAAFFLLMCLPKYYFDVKPQPIPTQLFQAVDLDLPNWANEYKGEPSPSFSHAITHAASATHQRQDDGPAAARGYRGLLLFSPNTSETATAVMRNFARDVACPIDPVKKSGSSQSFYALFRDTTSAAQCSDQQLCLSSQSCWEHVLYGDRPNVVGFATEEEALQRAAAEAETVDAIVTFNTGASSSDVSYTIRGNHTDLPSTRLTYNEFDLLPDPQYRLYWLFANIQQALDRAILGRSLGEGERPARVDVSVKPFPWPAVTFDPAAIAAAAAFNLLLVFAFLNPTRVAVATVDAAYWSAWALTHFTTMAVSGALCAAIALYPFPHTDPLLMLALLWLTAAALLSFAYFLSTLFAKSRVAGMASAMLYAVAMVPGYIMPTFQPYGGFGWPLACLLPPSAISLFATVLLKLEGSQQGVRWSTINLNMTSQYPFSAATVLQMLALDVLIYGLLTWYLDKVVASGYGQSLPWYFPVMPSYWRHLAAPGRSKSVSGESADGGSEDLAGVEAAVAIRHLCKDFVTTDGAVKRAVDDLSLDVPAQQVTALLGHNGAGKTTAISILTGMLPPTSGDAFVYGASILTDMPRIRQSLGVCPQFDILWPEITAREHLTLYAAIKGYRGRDAHAVAVAAARDVGLEEKLDSRAEELSGGQRRKLSVAIAFLGNPSIVFLDEPTSGMDPYSRRFTWEVIRQNRAGRAIVLTTHSMEEADLLADRIAIMAAGCLVAEGTPLDLKARYGVGYTLTLVKQRAPDSDRMSVRSEEGRSSVASMSRVVSTRSLSDLSEGDATLDALIRRHVPQAILVSRGPAELAFRLPKEETSQFPALLQDLEDSRAELGVDSYGLEVTTLEEVFLAVSAAASADAKAARQRSNQPAPSAAAGAEEKAEVAVDVDTLRQSAGGQSNGTKGSEQHVPLLRGLQLYVQQWHALFAKRVLSARRDPLAVVIQLLVPIALVLVALWARHATDAFPQEPALTISRQDCLRDQPALFGANPYSRSNASAALGAFMEAYPAEKLLDTGEERLWNGPFFAPAAGTLDGWLLDHWYSGTAQYDALFMQNFSSASEVLAAGGSVSYTVLFNTTATHGLPAALNTASNALLRSIQGPQSSIGVANHPMPTLQNEAAAKFSKVAGDLLLVLCLTMAASVLSASFAVFLVRERECHSKSVQMVAGAPPSAFWGATYAWDLLNFSIPALGIIVCFYCFDLPQFRGERMAAVVALLWLFGAAGLALTYLLSFAFSDEMLALQRINSYTFLVGYLGFLATWILDTVYSLLHRAGVKATDDAIKTTLRAISPHYALARGIYEVTETYGEERGEPNKSPWPWEAAGQHMAWLAIQAAVYMALTLLVESGWLGRTHASAKQALRHCWRALFRGRRQTRAGYDMLQQEEALEEGAGSWVDEEQALEDAYEDEDVKAERVAMQAGARPEEWQVLVAGLEKWYSRGTWQPPLRALSGLWLGVGEGECFGLLGVNGAGKTTAFRLLTGELRPDEGDAFVAGHSIRSQLAAARQQLGYCPQFSALPGALTGREVLRMYARLRGVPSAHIERTVEDLLQRIDLAEYADRVCETYSGGNKRKLSVAVALVGGPAVVLLDEPSTGMDPGAKRFLWDLIQKQVVDQGHTVLLTSHSMEECEALCSRIGILAAGRLRCLGAVQHLKNRFGAGYLLTLRLNRQQHMAAATAGGSAGGAPPALQRQEAAAVAWVQRAAPAAQLQPGRRMPGTLTFSIAQQDLDLPSLFASMEEARAELGVDEYSISQTTLEHVFVALAEVGTEQDGENSVQ